MISYSTLGTNDMQRSIRFYDPVFGALGGERTTTSDTWTGYGRKGDRGMFFLTQPFNKQQASPGNGTMLAVLAETRAASMRFTRRHWRAAGFAKARRACAPGWIRCSTRPTCATPTATSCVRTCASDRLTLLQLPHEERGIR